jgi:catechol 2,3-dioxygenase-like lactoylglutathione lyase family enzyme
MAKGGRINVAWHRRHPMPKERTLQQRVSWHLAHATSCGCREIPRTVLEALKAGKGKRRVAGPRRGVAGTVRTHGLTHINLAVQDPLRSLEFYARVFGVKEYYRDETQVQVQGPGPHDVLAFELDVNAAGKAGGIGHFGFRLVDPRDIDSAVEAVKAAGGKLLRRGEFGPGLPFAYVADPDGYEIEIWYE